jgi:hypothetical protein
MRRATWLMCLGIVLAVPVAFAADKPEKAAKPEAKTKTSAASTTTATAAPKPGTAAPKPGTAVPDARATSLFRSAQNLETAGKSAGAVGMYRDLLIRYPLSPEAPQATARIKALGGKLPAPSEIHPAPPPQEAKFTRAPKPKYASQAATRAALNEAMSGAVGGAMSQPAGGGGASYGGRAPYAP